MKNMYYYIFSEEECSFLGVNFFCVSNYLKPCASLQVAYKLFLEIHVKKGNVCWMAGELQSFQKLPLGVEGLSLGQNWPV